MHARSRLVLVVGDSLQARSLVQLVLGRLSYRVSCADDAAAAEAVLAREPVDLVLAATRLRDAEGGAFARRIRARHGVPVLLFGDAGELARARAEDPALVPADCFPRPVALDRLIARIRALLAARPPAGDGVAADAAAIRRRLLEVTGGGEGAEELLDLFLRTARDYLQRLEDGTAERLREVAHALKGAARNVGAAHLAALAERLERGGPDAAVLARARRHLDFLTRALRADATALS